MDRAPAGTSEYSRYPTLLTSNTVKSSTLLQKKYDEVKGMTMQLVMSRNIGSQRDGKSLPVI